MLCNSKATANELNSFFNIPSRKLETVPLGINHKEIYPINLERKNFFLVLGRHDRHKNLLRIIIAISKIKNYDFKVIFAGPFKDHLTKKLLQAINDFVIGGSSAGRIVQAAACPCAWGHLVCVCILAARIYLSF